MSLSHVFVIESVSPEETINVAGMKGSFLFLQAHKHPSFCILQPCVEDTQFTSHWYIQTRCPAPEPGTRYAASLFVSDCLKRISGWVWVSVRVSSSSWSRINTYAFMLRLSETHIDRKQNHSWSGTFCSTYTNPMESWKVDLNLWGLFGCCNPSPGQLLRVCGAVM